MSRSTIALIAIGAFAMSFAHAQTAPKNPQEISRQAEQAEAMAPPELSTRTDDLVEVVRPDGTKVIDLKGRFQMQTSIVRMPDGSMKTVCQEEGAPLPHLHAPEAAQDDSR